MLLDDLMDLRARLDLLAAGTPRAPGLFQRAAQAAEAPDELLALDRGLDRAGVFTLADARLLVHLTRERAKGTAEVRGLRRRARRAVAEVSALLCREERRGRGAGPPPPSTLADLEDHWARLARVVKVADLLADPERPREGATALLPTPRAERAPPQDARVAAAEYLLGRARASPLDEAQKRRALEGAHELLLRVGSELDRARTLEVRAEVGRERAALARAPAKGPLARLDQALRQGDGRTAWATSLDLYRDSVATRDAPLASASREVLAQLEPSVTGGLPRAVSEDRARRFLDAAGEGAIAFHVGERRDRDGLAALALQLSGDDWEVFDLALEAGRFFDVEEGAEEESLEELPYAAPARLVPVPYPGPVQTMDLARSISQLRQFVITDPRLVLYDLASNRQLVHSWLAPEGSGALSRKHGTGAVRVYVCDASGSMRGARARFRDAVLIAELNNLSVRESQGRPCVPLYFSFFTDHPAELERVDNGDAALRVVSGLFRESPAEGRTDITFALESAFAAIRDARGRDPDLARATVVLVTDGEDRVDLSRVWSAKAPLGEIEATLSFISLGAENRDLKELVLQQREAGRRAFYYHLDDEAISGGRALFDCGLRTLLPELPPVALRPDDPRVRSAVDALLALGAERQKGGVSQASPALRFSACFTLQPAVPGRAPPAADVERVSDLLAAVAETVALAPAEVRTAEAVGVLEHLQQVYGLRGERWALALTALPERGMQALEKIRLLGAPVEAPGGRAWD